MARGGSTSTGDKHKPSYRSRLVVQEYKRQAGRSFFTATPLLEALRSLLICLPFEELPNGVGQPVAWSELVVSILIDVRRAHFCSALGGASCGSMHGHEQRWPFSLGACMAAETRE